MAPIAPHHRTRGMVAPQNPYWCGSRIMMEYDTDVRCPQSPQHWAGVHFTGRVRKVDARPFSWTRELVKYDDFKSRLVLPRLRFGFIGLSDFSDSSVKILAFGAQNITKEPH